MAGDQTPTIIAPPSDCGADGMLRALIGNGPSSGSSLDDPQKAGDGLASRIRECVFRRDEAA